MNITTDNNSRCIEYDRFSKNVEYSRVHLNMIVSVTINVE